MTLLSSQGVLSALSPSFPPSPKEVQLLPGLWLLGASWEGFRARPPHTPLQHGLGCHSSVLLLSSSRHCCQCHKL